MLVVLDTNVLISALLRPVSQPAIIVKKWEERKFTLLTSETQIEELTRVTRYQKIKERINVSSTGRLINEVKNLAVMVDHPPL